ncbi:hypothetical protein ADK96_25910 [Streptomyces sp. IGB124]|nr:hypothetical protein ADK96_25910 [Streptomyces sp. IGB124]
MASSFRPAGLERAAVKVMFWGMGIRRVHRVPPSSGTNVAHSVDAVTGRPRCRPDGTLWFAEIGTGHIGR